MGIRYPHTQFTRESCTGIPYSLVNTVVQKMGYRIHRDTGLHNLCTQSVILLVIVTNELNGNKGSFCVWRSYSVECHALMCESECKEKLHFVQTKASFSAQNTCWCM